MRKKIQRGGDGSSLNWIKQIFGMVVIIFSFMIPILAALNYQSAVYVLTIVYGFFLFFYGAAGVSLSTNSDSDQSVGNNKLPSTIVTVLLWIYSILIIVTGSIYKHYTVFLPITIGIIGFIVLSSMVTDYLDNFNMILALGVAGPLMIWFFNQTYITTI
jgi:hypothetical protein